MHPALSILLLEDREVDSDLIQRQLRQDGLEFVAQRVWTEAAFLAGLRQPEMNLILADYALPAFDGLAALRFARELRPEVPFIFVTGHLGEELAIETLRQGATDYVLKGHTSRLGPAVQRALQEVAVRAEQRRAERAVADLAQFNQSVIDGLPAHLCVLADDGTIIAVNRAWRDFATANAANPSQIGLGANYYKVCAAARGDDQRMAETVLQGLQDLAGGSSERFECEYPCDSPSQPRWFLLHAAPLAPGSAGRLVLAHTDITRRKLAETAQQEGEARYRRLFEAESDCLFLTDCATHQILDANPAAERTYGYSLPEFLCMRAEQLSAEPEQTQRSISRGDVAVGLRWHRRRDGSRFPVEISNSYLAIAGRQTQVAAIRDVTQRKKAEDDLQDYQSQLRSLASELSIAEQRARREVASLLHDQAIQTLAVARIRLSQSTGEEAVAISHQEIESVRNLIGQTIDQLRSLTYQLAPPMLYELGLEAAVEWLAEEFWRRHGLRCRIDDQGGSKPLDLDLRATLFTGVRELLINVVKHAGVKAASVSITRQEGMIRIIVQDEGAGFEQAVATRPTHQGGFGLFDLRERLQHLGGSCVVNSTPGRGTTVTLRAPLTPARNPTPAPRAP